MYSKNSKTIYTTTNPLINLTSLLVKNNLSLDKENVNLFYSLFNANSHYDINESYYSSSDSNHDVIKYQNIFYFLSSLTRDESLTFIEYKNFFNFLFSKGLEASYQKQIIMSAKLSSFSNAEELTEYISNHPQLEINLEHSIYDSMEGSEYKNIFFLEHLHQTLPFEQFLSSIKKSRCLQIATRLNRYDVIDYLVNIGIDINLTDDKHRNSLMCCSNLESLKKIDSLGGDWFSKDVYGDNAYSCLSSIDDLIKRKEMSDYAKKRMEESVNNNGIIDPEKQKYIDETVRSTLLNLTRSDKTKKELQDFIKKNKPKDIGNIVDKDGNNLLMLCIKENNWARANLFLDDCNIHHQNKNGDTILDILLKKTASSIKRPEDAMPFLNLALSSYNIQDNSKSIFLSLLEHQLYRNEKVDFPKWIFKENVNYLKALGFPHQEAWHWKQTFDQDKNYDTSTHCINLYLSGFKKEEKEFNLNFELIINGLFNIHKHYQKAGSTYTFYSSSFKSLNTFISILNESEISYDKEALQNLILSKFKDFIQEGLLKHIGYSNSADTLELEIIENQHDFLNHVEPLFQYLIEMKAFKFISELSPVIWDYEFHTPEIKIGMQYAKLQCDLNENEERKIKRAKI